VGGEKFLSPKTEYQKLMTKEKIIYNHDKMNHNPDVLKRISLVPPGGNWKDIPKKFYNVGGEHSNNYRRLDPKKPAVTIKHAIKSMIIHPKYDRVIGVREVARLQSFDDSFIIFGTKSDQHQQLANAVPPLLGFALAKHLKEFLKKKVVIQIEKRK
jgi:DNA (cytosine-5)-methyltransferase 1